MCQVLFKLFNYNPVRKVLLCSHFKDEKTKAEEVEVIASDG